MSLIITRAESETDERFGYTPDKRKMEQHLNLGIVNLDKPSGPTSHQVVSYVKEIFNLSKAGHSGTLDPHVTGVLPTALEKATKVLYALLPAGKEYVGVMHVHKDVPEERLRTTVGKFVGDILQRPPVRSAVKRRLRVRRVYNLDILEIDGKDVLFRTNVQAGTYIRKLCSDIGARIGGAHMAGLRRTRAGPFLEKDSCTLQDLADAYALWKEEGREDLLRKIVLPVEAAVPHLKKVWVKDGAVNAICNGANLAAVGISRLDENIERNELLAIMSLKGELVALSNALMSSKEMLEKESGFAADTKRVVMPAEIYPRMWRKKQQPSPMDKF